MKELFKILEKEIPLLLNKENIIMPNLSEKSTRGIGDLLCEITREKFISLLTNNYKNSDQKIERKSMGDIVIEDSTCKYLIDVKSKLEGTSFNMPNITSIVKLSKLYANSKNYFILLLIDYKILNQSLIVNTVNILPIESISWDCLQIANIGLGQIQITNANKIKIDESISRNEWLLNLCSRSLNFLENLSNKIPKRMEYFITKKEEYEKIIKMEEM